MEQRRLVQVITGNGRGKTTSALGSALRAIGQGLKVYIAHFMKGSYPYGEQITMAKLPDITVTRFGSLEFVDPDNITMENKQEGQKALKACQSAINSGKYDLVILDEVNVAVAWGLVSLDSVITLIQQKPENVEIILTGRYAPPEIIALGDLVTEMIEIKHPYQQGIPARRGFEF